MRVIIFAVAGFLAGMTVAPAPVRAATGFDSAFAGESAFLSLAPGESGTFTVFFQNTGSTSWIRGSGTQVDLAACLADQVTCDVQDRSETPFDPGSWSSARRYGTAAQSTVAPGAIGTFSYGVKVPLGQALGTYRFNGDLVVSATGRPIHPEGYYHDLRVVAASCAATSIAASPAFAQVQLGLSHRLRIMLTCADGVTGAAGVPLTVAATAAGSGNASFVRTVTTDASGSAVIDWSRSNPGSDQISVSPAASPGLRAAAVVRWTVAASVLTCTPQDPVTRVNGDSRLLTIIAKDANTGAALVGAPLDVTVLEYISLDTATINGVSAVGKLPGFTVTTVTTDSGGAATISVNGTRARVAPRVFIDDDASDTLGAGEFRVDCGSSTFVNPSGAGYLSQDGEQTPGQLRAIFVAYARSNSRE